MSLGNHHLAIALLSHAQREIQRLGLGEGQNSANPLTASECESGVLLSDGLGLYMVCQHELEVNRVLREYRAGLDDCG